MSRQRARGIYDDDGGVIGGRGAHGLQRRQPGRRRRIYNASKGSETATEVAAARRRAAVVAQ